MAKRVMLFCVCCLLVSLILRTEALAGFGNVEWGASPQDIQQKLGIKELNKSPLLTKDKYFIWGEEWCNGGRKQKFRFFSPAWGLAKATDSLSKLGKYRIAKGFDYVKIPYLLEFIGIYWFS